MFNINLTGFAQTLLMGASVILIFACCFIFFAHYKRPGVKNRQVAFGSAVAALGGTLLLVAAQLYGTVFYVILSFGLVAVLAGGVLMNSRRRLT